MQILGFDFTQWAIAAAVVVLIPALVFFTVAFDIARNKWAISRDRRNAARSFYRGY